MVWVAEAYGFDSPDPDGLPRRQDRDGCRSRAGILNVFSRTPGALLQTAAGLDNVSAGRAVLGLGASGPQVIEGFHGLPYDKPLGRTREVIRLVRSGLKREPLESHGIFDIPLSEGKGLGLGKPLKILTTPERDTVPIWVASLGDKNVADDRRAGRRLAADPVHPRARERRLGRLPRRRRAPSATPSSARCRSAPAAWSRSART